jgi:hypothetical protein
LGEAGKRKGSERLEKGGERCMEKGVWRKVYGERWMEKSGWRKMDGKRWMEKGGWKKVDGERRELWGKYLAALARFSAPLKPLPFSR